jgi:hypothetical protein
MARGFSKAVSSQQRKTPSLFSINILKARVREHFANLKYPE